MTETARALLESFEALPELDKREVLAELLRQALEPPYSGPSDEDLVGAAEQLFLELERGEAKR